jgi:hypothetical protein
LTRQLLTLAALGGLIALPACTSGQSAVVPAATSVNVAATTKLQFAVGTANIAGTAGLNTVVTFRSTNGTSAALVNSPSIAGPAGFKVPADPNVQGNVDSGTSNITSTPQLGSTATTFGTAWGAFGYGFVPDNSGTSGAAVFNVPMLPFYVANTMANPFAQLPYILGPDNSLYVAPTGVSGFPGFALGFADFAATPVAGTYNLTVGLGSAGGGSITSPTAAATLTSTALLPLFTTPTYVSDGKGGGTITVTVPAGVSEAVIEVGDGSASTGAVTVVGTFTTTSTGAQTFTVPDGSIAEKDFAVIYGVGFDYPALQASPIGNGVPQTPTIVGANGQADVTTSAPAVVTE